MKKEEEDDISIQPNRSDYPDDATYEDALMHYMCTWEETREPRPRPAAITSLTAKFVFVIFLWIVGAIFVGYALWSIYPSFGSNIIYYFFRGLFMIMMWPLMYFQWEKSPHRLPLSAGGEEEDGSEEEAYENKNRYYFFIPKEASQSVLSQTSENIGEKIDHVCSIIERENPDLDGVLTTTTYNDKRKYPDDRLGKLISHLVP